MNTNLPLKITTLHFNFSENTITHLSQFAEIHKHDDRKTFKTQWEKWIQTPDISKIIQTEIEYQSKKGLPKMFSTKCLKVYDTIFERNPRNQIIKLNESNISH